MRPMEYFYADDMYSFVLSLVMLPGWDASNGASFFNQPKGNKGSACPRQAHLPTNLGSYSLTADPKHGHMWVMSDRVNPSALEHR